MRRLLPYLIIGLLVAAPFLTLTAVYAGQPQQEEPAEDNQTPAPVSLIENFPQFVTDVHDDLELLADEVMGTNIRPEGWTGNRDPASSSILFDLWQDLELLATDIRESEERPPEWSNAASSPTADRVARNLRHDLELLADIVFADLEADPGEDKRPDDWIGAPPIFQCSITTLNLLDYTQRLFPDYEITTLESVLDYCQAVALDMQGVLVRSGVSVSEGNVPLLLANIRGDLNRLADELYGLNESPPSYRNTVTLDAIQMADDLLFDIELIANDQFLTDDRPFNWIGDTGSTPGIAARNLRNDLELLSDNTLQDRLDHLIEGRPEGWSGYQGFGDELAGCPIDVRSLVLLMAQYYRYQDPQLDSTGEIYCQELAANLNIFAESDPEQISEEEREGIVGSTGRPVAESDFAFTYLDPGALQYMGVMPQGVRFEMWYRNFGESSMMYVVGEDFAVYVSWEWTTFPEERYYRLPTLDGVIPETYCFAEWCAGPGPTPTPTGQLPTPTPGAAPGSPPPGLEDLILIPWNQVNVFYDQDQPESQTVLVRLELCAQVGVGCEPVQVVYDGAGNQLPILNVIGPFPVFQMPYGYNNSFLLVSTSYYANEVWVSDPTLRGIN